MKVKKIKYLLFIIGLFFFMSGSALALTCKYEYNEDGYHLEIEFEITTKEKVSSAKVKGTMKSSDVTEYDESHKIENWDTYFSPILGGMTIYEKGQDYFELHNACNPYAVWVDRTGNQDLAVATDATIDQFIEYGKQKQGYAILTLVSPEEDPEEDPEQTPGSCMEFDETTCEHNNYFACIWNEKYGYCNVDKLLYVSCGDAFDIPLNVPKITKTAVNILKIATPIILIIISIITLLKALAASKDDEIKKAQQSLIKKIIIAAIVFFVITIVQFVISIVADTAEKGSVTKCLDCFLTGDCTENIYYKTNIGGVNYCTYVVGSNTDKEKTGICEDSK